jgi:hypothetical protein
VPALASSRGSHVPRASTSVGSSAPDVMAASADMTRVRALAEEIVPLLGLSDWRIVWLAGETETAGRMAEVDVRHAQRQASITLAGYFFSDAASVRAECPWQVTVIHELLHLRLGVYREHLHDAAYALTGDERRAELLAKTADGLEEAAVSQASWAIWDLYRMVKERHGR